MRERILKLIRKLDPSNPLEFTRELVAPLCKDKLNQLILECNDCKTCKNYEKKIAIGNPNANYLIINDNATDNEAINDYLNSILETAEIPLNDVFIINSVSCILKKTFHDEEIIRLPNRNEVNNCKHFVNYAIDFVKPRVIICMGATSLAMYRNDVTIDDVKGQFIEINGIKTLVTHSCKDLFVMLENYEQEEVDKVADNVLQDVISAKRYIETLKH